MQSQSGIITTKELKLLYAMITNHWHDFSMEKNANKKVNRWGLELATYNITFKWISGACKKAADCLSRMVELPQDRPATVQMLSTTNLDGPAFNTRSRTAQCNTTNPTPQPQSDAVTPDVTDTPSTTPKPLTTDRLQVLLQMQRTDPFCKHISKCLIKWISTQTQSRSLLTCESLTLHTGHGFIPKILGSCHT